MVELARHRQRRGAQLHPSTENLQFATWNVEGLSEVKVEELQEII